MNTDKLNQDSFSSRHIGPGEEELESMLETIGVASLEGLIEETVPSSIRLKEPLDLSPPISEFSYLEGLKRISHFKLWKKSQMDEPHIPWTLGAAVTLILA